MLKLHVENSTQPWDRASGQSGSCFLPRARGSQLQTPLGRGASDRCHISSKLELHGVHNALKWSRCAVTSTPTTQVATVPSTPVAQSLRGPLRDCARHLDDDGDRARTLLHAGAETEHADSVGSVLQLVRDVPHTHEHSTVIFSPHSCNAAGQRKKDPSLMHLLPEPLLSRRTFCGISTSGNARR